MLKTRRAGFGAGEGEVGVARVQRHAALAQSSPAGHGLVNKKCRRNVLVGGEVAGDGGEDVFLRQGGRHRLGMTGFSWTAAVPRAAVALSGRPVATLPARGRRLLFFFFFFFPPPEI